MHLPSLNPISRAHLDALVWASGLLLQSMLLTVLFTRGLARRAPYFTGLIAFYLVRSATLYLTYGLLNAEAYRSLNDLSQSFEVLADFGMGITFAALLVCVKNYSEGHTRASRILVAVALAIAAATLTELTGHVPRATVQPDRAQIFFAVFLLLLWSWSVILRTVAEPTRSLLRGFALYSAASFAASLGRARASLHHSNAEYAAWSYGLALAYLGVVVFWILHLLRLPEEDPELIVEAAVVKTDTVFAERCRQD
ncbi:hypothetical protein [Edaphobacter bradus]|uniref:hypothetical protein n=1 Tax=Edaphobacter bradus TaxID=2259016 RepID=UPI0021E087F8|nr:hypothetical protein [Edaphobacter bradus]